MLASKTQASELEANAHLHTFNRFCCPATVTLFVDLLCIKYRLS